MVNINNPDVPESSIRKSLVKKGAGGASHKELSIKKDVAQRDEISQDLPAGYK